MPLTDGVRVAWVSSGDADTHTHITARITTEGRVHHAFTGTGALNLAIAAQVPGTIPFQVLDHESLAQPSKPVLRIGHPAGGMDVSAHVTQVEGTWTVVSAGFVRTARLLFSGVVHL